MILTMISAFLVSFFLLIVGGFAILSLDDWMKNE